jgi:hypothetical protein
MKVMMLVSVLALVTAVRGALSNQVRAAVGYDSIVSAAQSESHQLEATRPDSESDGAEYLTAPSGVWHLNNGAVRQRRRSTPISKCRLAR